MKNDIRAGAFCAELLLETADGEVSCRRRDVSEAAGKSSLSQVDSMAFITTANALQREREFRGMGVRRLKWAR